MALTLQAFGLQLPPKMDANRHVHQLSHATVFFMDCYWLTVTLDPKIHRHSREVLQPAIELAEGGFPVSEGAAQVWKHSEAG